jgi:ubiquinone/menaquinone biosynthesis C-methylase UbiE
MSTGRPWGRLRARIYAFMFRDPESNRVTVELAGLQADDRALDVGCGPGAAVAAAAAQIGADHVSAVDPSAAMVEIARSRVPGADIRVAGAEALPFAEGAFTTAWTVASFHHWPDQQAGIAELSRVMAPNGRVLIVERHLRRGQGHGLSRQSAEALSERLRQAGFGRVSVTRHQAKRMPMLVLEAVKTPPPQV